MTEPMKTADDEGREEYYGNIYLKSIGANPDIMYSGDVEAVGAAFLAGQAAERERIKKVLKFRITFWNSTTQKKEPKYSYKSIFELIDSL